jgi:DNA-binding MarR family transcriptional regulator
MAKQTTTSEARTDECMYPAALLVCSDFVLGTLSVTVAEMVEASLAPLKLRLRHYRLLRLLMYEGPQLQSTIGPALGVDRTTVVALVDQLEATNLAKRVRSPDDRRAYRIAITDKGCRIVEKAAELVNAVEENMYSPLTADEREKLRYLSTRLLSAPGIIADAHAKLVNAPAPDPTPKRRPAKR